MGQLVGRKFLQHPEYGIDLVGFVDSSPRVLRDDLSSKRVLGGPSDLPKLIEQLDVERVVIAFSTESNEDTVELVARLKSLDVQIDIVPRLFDVVGPNVNVHSVEGLALLGLPSPKLLPFSRTIKRSLDIVASAILLLLTSPLFAFIAWRIRRGDDGPVLFRQERLGQKMQPFTALKFRTMKVDTDTTAHREFIRATMSADATPTENGLYKLERPDAITPHRALAAQDEPRRAAAAAQRPARRDVARRPAALPRLRDRGLRCRITSSDSASRPASPGCGR